MAEVTASSTPRLVDRSATTVNTSSAPVAVSAVLVSSPASTSSRARRAPSRARAHAWLLRSSLATRSAGDAAHSGGQVVEGARWQVAFGQLDGENRDRAVEQQLLAEAAEEGL